MRITLLCIGKVKSSWIAEGCRDYSERLERGLDFKVMELPASKEKDSDRQRADESARLFAAAQKFDGDLWILDERGKGMASEAFAKELGKARDDGRSLTFILGGAYGLTDAVRSAGKLLRLSDMTLPHELCRVLFLEQLYRANEIIRGSGYHH
ncbi:hypothetical protein A3D88_03495 [Candidatus Peribacteria bacterium RIFCSPHIGHO2_02_FULL_52_16]|nr:MAG: hypothetical protein A2706_04310 [Candidatus Peribacteria bacterium RIFCSPHIGHO2_01_FULL_51_35]OGJ61831.1 MAG: hypothetical protein A3D88_03495 [Candidatus Peribacteria bacterium RIFCSPHIGHO2_02_FULL_52_16]